MGGPPASAYMLTYVRQAESRAAEAAAGGAIGEFGLTRCIYIYIYLSLYIDI